MKPFLLPLLALLLLPAAAWAQHEFPLPCDNVRKILIIRVDATHWNIPSDKGYFHCLFLKLAEPAAEELQAMVDAKPQAIITAGDGLFPADITVTAHGVPLQSAAPEWDFLGKDGIALPMVREEDAFQAARQICPALVPKKVLLDEAPWQEYR